MVLPVRRLAVGLLASSLVVAVVGCSSGGSTPPDASQAPSSSGSALPDASQAPSSRASQAAPTSSSTPTGTTGGGQSSSKPTGSATGPAEPSAPPTTPTPGSTAQTVPSRTQESHAPVGLDRSAAFDKTLTAKIAKVTARSVKAKLPGEVSGPAVVLTLTVQNRSSREIDLNRLVVNLADAEGDPADRITSSPATAMPHAVAAGSSASARYVFVVPRKARSRVTIEVSLDADQPVLVFKGPVA